jgi:hypothetical protein
MLDRRDSGSDMELLNMRCAPAALDVELKLCRLIYLVRKHGADQPRVPPGSPEGGQWTSGGGGGGGGGADDSAEADGDAQIQLVQGDPLQGYPVDLREEERRGGHTIEGHVGKSDSYLKTEVQEMAWERQERDEEVKGLRVGSFTSLDSAAKLVNSTLSQNSELVNRVARGEQAKDSVSAIFDSPTGYEAYLRGPYSIPYMRDTYGVGVIIVHDPRTPRGYRVQTAYPRN